MNPVALAATRVLIGSAVLARVGGCGAGAELSEQADPHHPALRPRRHHRHRRAQSRAAAERKHGAIGGGGESSGRRRHGGRRCHRPLRAGRLYHPADRSCPRFQSDPAKGRALRSVQGVAGGFDRRLVAGGDRRVAELAGEDVRRAHRLCQGQSGQAQFRLRRHRHRAASRRRNDQAAHRHRHDARALPRHRRGLPRRHEREGAARILEHRRRGAVHQRQPGAAARHHRFAAQPGLSRRADGGGNAARLRRRFVDRHLRVPPACRRRCWPSSTAKSARCCSIPN